MMLRKFAIFSLIVLCGAPLSAWALGLGEIKLNSALNEPLDAEIELVAATPAELGDFKASIASLETFQRYGLDRPVFLGGIRFQVTAGPDGPVLRVRSAQPIPEPFVTFLVEATWARGRLLREYTVLLDPPVFNLESSAPPPLEMAQSITTQSVPQSGQIVRPQPAPPPSPRRQVNRQPAVTGTSYGPIRRNETLWAISKSALGDSGVTMNQMMIAIYRANPDAFIGNINLLKEGSTISIPELSTAASVSTADAFTIVRDHEAAWRGGTRVASAAPAAVESADSRRLRLVAPDAEDDVPAGPGASADMAAALAAAEQSLADQRAQNDELSDEMTALRSEIEELRRLINIRDTDIAEMQSRLGTQGDVDVPLPATDATAETAIDEVAPAADVAATAVDTADVTTPDDIADTMDATDDAVAAADTPDTTTAVTTPPAAVVSSPSFMERALGLLGNLWLWIGIGLAALAGAVLLAVRGRGSDADAVDWGVLSQEVEKAPAAKAAVAERAAPAEAGEEVEYFEDTGTFKPVDFAETDDEAGEVADFPFEDTMAGEQALKLDQSDPLAEADFHMAYGLYDQAAELVRSASVREPERRDLKMKLLEIFFVWGNKDQFVDSARTLHEEMGGRPDADWDKILIMGKQICPDEALFSGDAAAPATGVVDLELDETGAGEIDLMTTSTDDSSVDLDIGGALSAGAAGAAADNVIDFDFGGGAEAPPMSQEDAIRTQVEALADKADNTQEMDLSELGIDLDFGEATDVAEMPELSPENLGEPDLATGGPASADSEADFDEIFAGFGEEETPAVESTADLTTGDADQLLDTSELKVEMEELLAAELPGGAEDDDITERGDLSMPAGDETSDRTIETGSFSAEIRALSEDSLDLDLPMDLTEDVGPDDQTVMMEQAADVSLPASDDDLALSEVFGADDATVLAQQPDFGPEGVETGIFSPSGDTMIAAAADLSEDEETFKGVFEAGDSTDPTVLDVSSDDETAEMANVDLDVGHAVEETGDGTTVKVAASDLALPDTADSAINEVGTKLDLARAYMDMGDPDGARGILEEVIQEGDDGQKRDARALLDALP